MFAQKPPFKYFQVVQLSPLKKDSTTFRQNRIGSNKKSISGVLFADFHQFILKKW